MAIQQTDPWAAQRAKAAAAGYSNEEINQFLQQRQVASRPAAATVKPAKKKKNFWVDQISTGTSILGGIGGTVFGTPLAGVAAAGAGGALGEAIENIITGDSITKNVAKEGAISAVFGAGPIKILKATGAGGLALAKGAGVTAAKQAAGKAAVTPLRQAAGKAAVGAADDLALKSFKINDSTWLNAFKKNIGEDAGTFARRVGLVGQAPEQITKNIHEPLQAFYKQAIAQTQPIPKAEIAKGLKSAYEPLINSVAQSQKSIGLQVKSQADDILKALPDQVNASDAYGYKKLFDELVDQSLTDSSGKLANNVNKKIADVFRRSINNTASKSGIVIDPTTLPIKGVKATDLQTLGKELQGIQEFVKKAGVKENVGRGKNLAGLMNVIALTGGGSMGGVPGAAVALAATNALGSKAAANMGTNALSKYGGKLAATEGGQSLKGMAQRLGTVGALQGLANQSPQQPASLEDALLNQDLLNSAASPNSTNIPNNVQSMETSSGLSSPYAQQSDMSSGYAQQPVQSPYPKENLLYDLRRDPSNSSEYIKLYKQYDEIFGQPAQEQLTLSDSAITKTTDNSKAMQGLDELDAILQDGYAGGAVSGNIRKYNPFDTDFKTQQASIDRIRQIVGKALEGGVLRKEDEDKYKKILPTMQDQPEVYRAKVEQLRIMMGTDINNYLQLQSQYGKGAGSTSNDLTSAIMSAQTAY